MENMNMNNESIIDDQICHQLCILKIVFQNYKRLFNILNFDSNLDDQCEPYSIEACIKAAQSIGYYVKSTDRWDFAGDYNTKGILLIMRSYIGIFWLSLCSEIILNEIVKS